MNDTFGFAGASPSGTTNASPSKPMINLGEEQKQGIVDTATYLFVSGLDKARQCAEQNDSEAALRWLQISHIAGVSLLGVGANNG